MTDTEVNQIICELKNVSSEVKKTHDKVTSVEQLLKGYNGYPGLLDDFQSHKKKYEDFVEKEYTTFKNRTMIIFAFSAGGGALIGSGATVGILKALGG